MHRSQAAVPFRIIPITRAEDLPCDYVRRERMREKLCAPYRLAAEDFRRCRRAFALATEQRQQSQNLLTWMRALFAQIDAGTEMLAARRWQTNLAQGLDDAAVHKALGWPLNYPVACAHQAQERPSPLRRIGAVAASFALAVTPVKADLLPPTANQKIEWLSYLELCQSAASSGGRGPDMPMPPCHAPKTGVEPTRRLLTHKTLA